MSLHVDRFQVQRIKTLALARDRTNGRRDAGRRGSFTEKRVCVVREDGLNREKSLKKAFGWLCGYYFSRVMHF